MWVTPWALHSSLKVGTPVKIFVQIRPAIHELQGAKVLVTLIDGLGASTCWMLSKQHVRAFFISFCSSKDGLFVLCYAMLFISYYFWYSLENELKIFCFFALQIKQSFGAKIWRNFHLRMGSWPIWTWVNFPLGLAVFEKIQNLTSSLQYVKDADHCSCPLAMLVTVNLAVAHANSLLAGRVQ